MKLNISKKGARGVQTNSFYFCTVNASSELTKIFTHTNNISIFKTNIMTYERTCPKSSRCRAIQRGTDLPANLDFLIIVRIYNSV